MQTMTLRAAKTLLVAAVAFYYTLVFFNNCTDYGSNFQFVHHVLAMDTTFPGNHGMWRSIHSIAAQTIFYSLIILWEALTAAVCWWGSARMLRALRAPAKDFDVAKQTAVAGLTLSLLMWLVAFLSIGAEWFLMWQSQAWNGQQAAARMFTIVALVLILVVLPEQGVQP